MEIVKSLDCPCTSLQKLRVAATLTQIVVWHFNFASNSKFVQDWALQFNWQQDILLHWNSLITNIFKPDFDLRKLVEPQIFI